MTQRMPAEESRPEESRLDRGKRALSEIDGEAGERVIAADPLRGRACEVEIVSAHFVDPQGERLRG